jgi:LPS-assembly protein
MRARTCLVITAAWVCHLLLTSPLVTSQLLPASNPARTGAGNNVPLTIEATTQEKEGDLYKLQGDVKIRYGVYTLSADRVTYNQDSGQADAEGDLVLEGGPNDEHIEAARGSYNLQSETGKFENVTGTIGVQLRRNRTVLTGPNPFFFHGRTVEKTGPDHYIVTDGTITTCELPRPKWMFAAHKVDVEAGGNAKIYRTDFRLEGIPVLFLPFATHPVQKAPRQSGFLIPNIGRSSTRGYTVGESVFWAIRRDMDLLAGAEYFSKRGWAPDGEVRFRPTEDSFADLTFFSVLDRGINGVSQGGTEIRLNAEGKFWNDTRAVANVDYLSRYVFRLAFSDVFAQAANSEVKSDAFLTNSTHSVFLNAHMRRYQNFQSTNIGDVVTILHAPGIEASGVDQQLWGSPFHGAFDVDVEGLSRSEPGFRTAPLVGRFDLNPSLSLPWHFDGWSFRPEISARDTIYTQQLIPSTSIALTDVGTVLSQTINRKSLQARLELRPPALDRVFDHEFLGRKWKHVIEPRINYTYLTGVENFSHILRFDDRDILSDTNEVEYALVNRLYAKRTSSQPDKCAPEGMPSLIVGGAPAPSRIPWERSPSAAARSCQPGPETREVLTWELAQKYFIDPTFGGALVPGRRNVFESTVDLTGIAFLTDERRLSPLVSRLRLSLNTNSDLEWDADYDFRAGRVNTSTVLFNHHFGEFTVGAGNALLHTPGEISTSSATPITQKFNQFRSVLGYGSPNKRGFSGAVNLGFDARLNQLQYGSAQLAYNWDCCGLNVEYRRFALAVRNENQYRFTFSLANVGAFGNLRRSERLF